jgi:hypothetical protein
LVGHFSALAASVAADKTAHGAASAQTTLQARIIREEEDFIVDESPSHAEPRRRAGRP